MENTNLNRLRIYRTLSSRKMLLASKRIWARQTSAGSEFSGCKLQTGYMVVVLPEHEAELQQEVLEIIGACIVLDTKRAAAVNKDAALRRAEVLRNGLLFEKIRKFLEKYPPLKKCSFIFVSKLKAEIITTAHESAIKRDKRIDKKQERISTCFTVLGKDVSIARAEARRI